MRRVYAGLFALVVLAASAPGFTDPWPSPREAVSLKARPFDLQAVRLLDGPFCDAMQRTRRYLHELEEDRLLYYFRETAGLNAPGEPMGGWERTEVRGHTMGHYLSACAMMVAATGDKELRAKLDRIVAVLAECQKAHGNGYLSAFPESFIDRVIECKRVWAPWYTLHKILAGLIDVHVCCGSPEALQAAERMAAWVKSRLDPLDRDAVERMLNATEQGGMNEALANLHGLTGDRRWLELSLRFVEDHYVQPLARGEDRLKGEHVNSFIPNILGTARQYELAGEDRDRRIVEFFWNQVVGHRSYCTGGTSLDEHWRSDPGKLADQLGEHTQETCCTYNMLKLTRHLFAWKPDRKYADYYERALLNSILATQDPKTGMMMYFVTLAAGRWKYYNTPRDSFWCCTGTGMENHARYGESIYFHDETGIWVNLFIASEVDWKAKGVRLRQETRFPEEEQTSLVVNTPRPVQFALRLRLPEWASGAAVRLNGKPLEASTDASGYLAIDRTWSDGDRIEMTLPMQIRAWPMPDDPTLLAVMYGPLVLAGRLGAGDVAEELVYTKENWFKFPEGPIASAPDIVTENPDPAAWVRPVAGEPLTFRTVGVGRPQDVTLVPYHRLWGERYAVYWRVLPEAAWQKRQAERKAREAAEAARREKLRQRLVDEVVVGDARSERLHGLKGERIASGMHLDRTWRHATDGWFSYTIKTLPDKSMSLFCTYWGSDAGPRTFDILVDGTKIATQTLARNQPDRFFDIEYPIPPELTRGKSSIVVKFAAQPGQFAGGVFGCAMLKPSDE